MEISLTNFFLVSLESESVGRCAAIHHKMYQTNRSNSHYESRYYGGWNRRDNRDHVLQRLPQRHPQYFYDDDDGEDEPVPLPTFTGEDGHETWSVYFQRFQIVAKMEGWTKKDKLRELLLRLQGNAGKFVFDQLPQDVCLSYRKLTRELDLRFRKVEISRSFASKFSWRNQSIGETVEEYAAELKHLYYKAHANRDRETRREDLLRRFLDGIEDQKARFHVEYIKQPFDIDDAVFEVVNYLQIRRSTKISYMQQCTSNAEKQRHHESAQAAFDHSIEATAYSEDNTPARYNHTRESGIQWLKDEMLEIGLALATASVLTASSVDDHLICTTQDDISAPTVTRDDLKKDTSKVVTIEKEEESPPEHPECDISTI